MATSHDRAPGQAPSPCWLESRTLGGLAFILFVAALALPAIRAPLLGKPVDFQGFQSVCWAFGFAIWSALDPAADHLDRGHIGFVLLGLSALSNLLFVLPLWWVRRRPSHRAGGRLVLVWAFCVTLALVAPFVPDIAGLTRLGGYDVWIVAYVVLGAASSPLAARR